MAARHDPASQVDLAPPRGINPQLEVATNQGAVRLADHIRLGERHRAISPDPKRPRRTER